MKVQVEKEDKLPILGKPCFQDSGKDSMKTEESPDVK